MDAIEFSVHESMIILDGRSDAALPSGSGGPVLAGPEAIFVAGRVEFDAPTRIRIGTLGQENGLQLAYRGVLATPEHVLRIVSIDQEVLGVVPVPGAETELSIYLTDFEEPDEIFVAVLKEQGSLSGS